MRSIIKIAFLSVICAIILSSCAPVTDNVIKLCDKEKYLYLVVGFDDAAENTDVLFTLGYDKGENVVHIAQIPRDTYVDFGASQNKINQIFASSVYAGRNREEALSDMKAYIERLFGVRFDGYIGITTSGFRRIVDAVGGVDIDFPSDVIIEIDGEDPLVLNKGINHLVGSAAEKFVRYRKGYVMGDLGRIDAQKIFLSALFHKLSQDLTLPALMRIAGVLQNDAMTDVRLASFTSVAFDALKDGADIKYITMPGEPAVGKNNLSYYVINKRSASEIASRYMFAEGEFDPQRKLTDPEDSAFTNIYEDDEFDYREYRDTSLSRLPMNKKE